jgi:hypothetical protein
LTYDKKASVYAYKEALDAWRIEREKNLEVVAAAPVAVSAEEDLLTGGTPAPLPQREAARRRRIGKPMFAAVMICLIAGAIVFIRSVSGHIGEKRPRVRPLSIAAGTETMPAFSPDGTRVAHVGGGGQDEEAQSAEMSIFIKQVDADKTVRVTHSVWDVFPQSVTNFLAAAPRGNRLAWSTAIYGPLPPVHFHVGRCAMAGV